MPSAEIEKKGLEPILKDLKILGGWPVLEKNLWKDENFDWKNTLQKLGNLGYKTNYLFEFGVDINLVNTSHRSLFVRNYF